MAVLLVLWCYGVTASESPGVMVLFMVLQPHVSSPWLPHPPRITQILSRSWIPDLHIKICKIKQKVSPPPRARHSLVTSHNTKRCGVTLRAVLGDGVMVLRCYGSRCDGPMDGPWCYGVKVLRILKCDPSVTPLRAECWNLLSIPATGLRKPPCRHKPTKRWCWSPSRNTEKRLSGPPRCSRPTRRMAVLAAVTQNREALYSLLGLPAAQGRQGGGAGRRQRRRPRALVHTECMRIGACMHDAVIKGAPSEITECMRIGECMHDVVIRGAPSAP